jgi:hypothetical protein
MHMFPYRKMPAVKRFAKESRVKPVRKKQCIVLSQSDCVITTRFFHPFDAELYLGTCLFAGRFTVWTGNDFL